jgi:hypothetical protein
MENSTPNSLLNAEVVVGGLYKGKLLNTTSSCSYRYQPSVYMPIHPSV